jgi:hypothetical protein
MAALLVTSLHEEENATRRLGMWPHRSATILYLSALIVFTARAAATAQNISNQVPSTCPITKASNPPYTPPPPYPSELGDGFWFGSEKLWTHLPANGTWSLGHYDPTRSAFRQKLLWYRKGFNPREEFEPRLIVTGKRLDASAPSLDVDGPNGAWRPENPADSFMVVALNIPATGCWEITGQYGEDKLSFVVWVEDGTRDRAVGK